MKITPLHEPLNEPFTLLVATTTLIAKAIRTRTYDGFGTNHCDIWTNHLDAWKTIPIELFLVKPFFDDWNFIMEWISEYIRIINIKQN